MSLFHRFLRILLWSALVAYFMVALAYLGLRYWVAPNIDVLRPYIVQQFSEQFGVQLSVAQLQVEWSGSGPAFQMRDVSLRAQDGGNVLALPLIDGRLSWLGLWRGELTFRDLMLDGLELAIHRNPDGSLTFFSDLTGPASQAGQDAGVGLNHPLVQWLSRQRLVVFRNARLVWSDDVRDGQALTLSDVTVAWQGQGGRFRLDVAGQPPEAIGKGFQLKGEFTLTDPHRALQDPDAWHARLYVAIRDTNPSAWRAWVDIPPQLKAGRLSAQWWLDVERSQPMGMALEASLAQGRWQASPNDSVDVESAHLSVRGDWRTPLGPLTVEDRTSGSAVTVTDDRADQDAVQPPGPAHTPQSKAVQQDPLELSVHLQGLKVVLPDVFAEPLALEEATLAGTLAREGEAGLALTLAHARLVNADMDVSLSGSWRPHPLSETGWAELTGTFDRASLAAIHRYLPLTVQADARDWMRTGLLAGQVRQARFLVRGPLDAFPFGETQQGEAADTWRLDGDYEDAIIDYAPGATPREGWPRIEAASGRLAMRGNDLRVVADTAVVQPAPDRIIHLRDVQAHIPDLAHQATLTLQGDTEAQASAYLALMRSTPLSEWLGGTFDETQASGRWELPLRLTVPLLDADASRVRGQLRLHDTQLRLFANLPVLEGVNGALEFSEWGASTKGLTGRFLGGTLALRGGLGKGQVALGGVGHATVSAMTQAFGLDGLTQLSGGLDYQLRLERTASGRYGLTLQSDLVGLAARLPQPLGKEAKASWPVRVSWHPQGQGMVLDIDLDRRGQARFVHDPSGGRPYFHAAAIGLGRAASLPSHGLSIEIQTDTIDLGAWREVLAAFPDTPGGHAPAWPDLHSLRIQARQLQAWGMNMDQATVTARQTDDHQWRLDVSSTQSAGTLFWRQAQGTVAGKVQAHFARLALDVLNQGGEASDAHDEAWRLAEELDLPGIQLQVDDFVVAGRHLGSLTVDGVNVSRGRLWRLASLALKSPSVQLTGQGEWRLEGPQRGLALHADVQISDAGAYLEQVGLDGVMEGGRGSLGMQLQWRNLPWRLDIDDVQGTVTLALNEGRFSAVRSRSVKVLELLSMQSLQRVLNLDVRPGSMFASGFPFDTWTGTLHIADGLVQTNDYRVEGPAGTISLAGSTCWRTEELDLQAMVVPKLDISGASLAAGLLNPVVGLGAFLTQWMLKKPLARAMTVHYEVKGTWTEPRMREVSVSEAASSPRGGGTGSANRAKATSEEGVGQ